MACKDIFQKKSWVINRDYRSIIVKQSKTNKMKTKLNHDILKIESFVSSIEADASNTIVGGAKLLGACHYDTEINGGDCVKSAFSDCAIPTAPARK